MMPILYAAIVLLLSVNFILGLPHAVDLAQTKLAAANVPNNLVAGDKLSRVAGVQDTPVLPKSLGAAPPDISATSALAMDLGSNFFFFVKDPDKRVPIASTTKVMTALVATEYFQANQLLSVPDTSLVSGSTMGLKLGETLTFRSLLYGMLLNSGNDAAYAIAANFPGGVISFVEAMNRRAISLGLTNTHFDNPAGFDSPSHYSSAFDLAKIAALASENPQLARAFATREATVASADKTVIHPLKNLNKLLDIPGVLGIKTGTTPVAKENFIGLVERDDRRILTVVLGSGDRFGETQQIVDWVYKNFTFSP